MNIEMDEQGSLILSSMELVVYHHIDGMGSKHYINTLKAKILTRDVTKILRMVTIRKNSI